MELVDGLHIWRVSRETLFGGDVLAGVVAFRGAVPEEEAAVEGCVALGEVWGGRRGKCTYWCGIIAAIGFFTNLKILVPNLQASSFYVLRTCTQSLKSGSLSPSEA
jgi:hypothetical protein